MPKGSTRFRNRKINFKSPLAIYHQAELPDLDEAASLQRSVPLVESGVEKDEEEEHHLQAAISASQAAVITGEKGAPIYIPTPDASQTVKDYDALYPKTFQEPSSYIRFSTTVEDCTGVPYNLDEDDDRWLKNFNKSRRKGDALSEDGLELIMNQFEKVTDEKVPYLILDPSQVPSIADFEATFTSFSLSPLKLFVKFIYPHWKSRRDAQQGKPIQPRIVFEESDKNEGDSYVCFRRREIKSMRKTRRSDAQSLEKLRRLRSEMEQARSILERVCRRERLRKESLALEQEIFNQRVLLKDLKRKLGLKEADDELLNTNKKKRKVIQEISTAVTQASGNVKIPDLGVIPPPGQSQSEIALRDKEAAIQRDIEAALQKKLEANIGWEDVTDTPYHSFPKPTPMTSFRRLESVGGYRDTCFRRRVGRGGRVYLDRRIRQNGVVVHGRICDRFRFDENWSSDEDEEEGAPVVIVDDNDVRYQTFRSQLLKSEDMALLMTSPTFLTTAYPIPSATSVHSGIGLNKSLQGSKYGTSGSIRTSTGSIIGDVTGKGGSGVGIKKPGGLIPTTGSPQLVQKNGAAVNSNASVAANSAAVKKAQQTVSALQNGRVNPLVNGLGKTSVSPAHSNGNTVANAVASNSKLTPAQLQLNQLMAANLLQQQSGGSVAGALGKLNNAQAMRLMALIQQQQQQQQQQSPQQQQQQTTTVQAVLQQQQKQQQKNSQQSTQQALPTQQQLALAAILQAAQQHANY